MSDVTPFRMACWRYICERDRLETLERLRPVSPPPMFCDRLRDDYAEADAMGEFALKTLVHPSSTS